MMTPRRRVKTSKAMMRKVVRVVLRYLGQPASPGVIESIARATFPAVSAGRAEYQGFAVAGYRAFMRANDRVPIEPPPIRDYKAEDWRKAVERVAESHPVVGRKFAIAVSVRSDLHARNAERNQGVAFAVHDEQIAGWARIDRIPPTCPLCRLTISRGPVYSSADAAGGDTNTYHGGCTCEVVYVLKGQEDSWDGIEYYRAEVARYKAATKGKRGPEVQRAWRRAVATANKQAETGDTLRAAQSVVNTERNES